MCARTVGAEEQDGACRRPPGALSTPVCSGYEPCAHLFNRCAEGSWRCAQGTGVLKAPALDAALGGHGWNRLSQRWGDNGHLRTCSSLVPPPLPSGREQLPCFQHFRTEKGSSQGQNLALTGSFVPSTLDRGAGMYVNTRTELGCHMLFDCTQRGAVNLLLLLLYYSPV